MPDRAEFRHKAASAIVTLTLRLPSDNFSRVVRWFFSFAHNEKSAHRLFAIEVMGRLLNENERVGEETNDHGQRPLEKIVEEDEEMTNGEPEKEIELNHDLISHKFIFGVIFSKCKDASASVRAKSLQALSEITAANNNTMATVIKNIFSESDPNTETSKHHGNIDFVELLRDPQADLTKVNPLPSTDSFIDFLRRRALDDSVYVRKSALQVLENILKFNDSQEPSSSGLLLKSKYGRELVGILAEHCRDPSLMVRKQMVISLGELVKTYPENDVVVQNWVEGTFPLILDVELKAAEKVHENIWELLFTNIIEYERSTRNHHFLPWKILSWTEKLKMTKYLSRACGFWAKQGLLKPKILKVLKSHVYSEENSNFAWLLLALVSGHVHLEDPQFVMDYFNDSIHTPEGVGLYTLLQVLRVLFASVSQLADDQKQALQHDLITLVRRFSIPPELISTAVDICTIISQLEATPKKSSNLDVKQYHRLLDSWVLDIIQMIDSELSDKLLKPENNTESSIEENTRMTRQIFTLGELAQISPHRINKKLFLLMQSIVFQQSKGKRRKEIQEDQNSQDVKVSWKPTATIQAVSVISLAKMCLQNEEMAKKIIPAFGRLLDTTKDVAIKNNIMYALTDMCVRYASLVDPLLPQMTACLKEKSLVVRRTTLTTLIHLLQEDYLKMNAGMFFRILQTLGDESEEILNLTVFYFQQRLLKRKPKVMYSHFIEAIFHFNEYVGHQSYNKFVVSNRERLLFSLKGRENKNERMKLYKFMLEHMNDEQRFQTTYKLCQDILNGCVEGSVKLDYELLQDTLSILASEEIKLMSLKTRNEDEEQPIEDVEGAVIAAAKKTLISQYVKKNVIENIIPIVISLKHKLEEEKSSLLDDLMNYLREVMKDYKNEVKEILSADKQLASEIQYDLKKWEEEQAEIRRQMEEKVMGFVVCTILSKIYSSSSMS